jgi:hypothetical protein
MPFNNQSPIGTTEVINILLQQGGEFEYNNSTNLIIGIALLAVGGVIFIGENNYSSVNGTIDYLNCNVSNCLLGVQFTVNGNTYKKDFSVDASYTRPANNQVTITYEIANPNNNYLGTSSYNTIMYILLGTGIFFMALWGYLSSPGSKNTSFYVPGLSIYTKTETPSGLYVVSKK